MMEVAPLRVLVFADVNGDHLFKECCTFNEAGQSLAMLAECNIPTSIKVFLPVLSPLNVKYFGNDEASGMLWASFPREWSDEQIKDAWIEGGAAPWPTKCHEGDLDCCGRLFRNGFRIVRKGSRALATQFWGYDI